MSKTRKNRAGAAIGAVMLTAGLPAMALAGVVDGGGNPFVQHAESGLPFGAAAQTVPAPPRPAPNPVALPAENGANPPFTPPSSGQLSATGFSSVGASQPEPVPGTPKTVVHSHPAGAEGIDGYVPFPNAKPDRLPPPLPSNTRQKNRAISLDALHGQSSAPLPPPPPPHQAWLRAAYIPRNAARPRTKTVVVDADSLRNVVLNLSGYAPNILVTPFHHPVLIYTEKGALTWSPYGDRMILSIDHAHPVGVIVTGKVPSDPTISMTLVPQKTTGRNYRLKIENWTGNPEPMEATAPESGGSARNRRILAVMKAAALGRLPEGYTRSRRLPDSQAIGGLTIAPYAKYANGHHALVEYRVNNAGTAPVRLVESDFYHAGVTAVSFWPGAKVPAGGEVKLFILSKISGLRAENLGFVGRAGE